MKIAFDATAILADFSRNRGIGNCVSSWLDALLNLDRENQYFCLNMYERMLDNDWVDRFSHFQEIRYYSGDKIEIIRLPEYKDIMKKIVLDFLEIYGVDVFLILSPFDPVLTVYEKDWFKGVKTVALVYDIIPYIFKESFFTDRSIQKKYMEQVDMLHWVDICLAISESTKNDLVNYLKFLPSQIDVLWIAADKNVYKKLNLTPKEGNDIRNRFGIKGDFFLCVGGEDPRKNTGRLIEAYLSTGLEVRNRFQLVMVCRLSEKKRQEYLAIADGVGASDRLVFTGFILNEDLVKLYNLSWAMLFPSLYEGFGLPVVEAWQCGTAVLTSNNSSLQEISGDAAVLVDAESTEDITRGIEQIADENWNHFYRKKGEERVRQFSWQRTAQKTLQIIKQLPDKTDYTKKIVRRIAFFSPLAPVKSGISDYSYDILCELSQYFDVDVFIDNGYEPECVLPENIRVYRHYDFAEKKSDYDEIIYQVGNSAYHRYMFSYIQEFKGIVVLHDLNLHPILEYTNGIRKGRKFVQYKKALCEDMSEAEANAYISRCLSNYTSGSVLVNPVNGFVVNYAKAIIVHSFYARDELLKKNPTRNVAVIPLYTKVAKEIQDCEHEQIHFAVFGYISATKRIMPILKAFKKLVQEERHVNLTFVGEFMDDYLAKEFYHYLSKYKLQDKVELTGYVSLEDMEKLLEQADICLNLRYPYSGESSGTLARIVGKGKCCIVNNVGSFSELPDEACIKIPSVEYMTEQEEVEKIFEAMKKALDVKVRSKIEKNAYRYAKDNLDIHVVGQMYRDIITGERKRRLSNQDLQCLLKQERQKTNR